MPCSSKLTNDSGTAGRSAHLPKYPHAVDEANEHRADGGRSQPPSNECVIRQETRPSQQVVPVVDGVAPKGAHEFHRHGSRIGHVARHAEEIGGQPATRKGDCEEISLPVEDGNGGERCCTLQQRSPGDIPRCPEQAEDHVSQLMQAEVEPGEDAGVGRIVKGLHQNIEEQHEQRQARDP